MLSYIPLAAPPPTNFRHSSVAALNRSGFEPQLPPTCGAGPKFHTLHHTTIIRTHTLMHQVHLKPLARRPRSTPLGHSFAPSRMECSRVSKPALMLIRRVLTPPLASELALQLFSLVVLLPLELASVPAELAPRFRDPRLLKLV